MDGIIVVDKEKGYTSRDIVNVVSKILNTKKVGHTGTLDPIATGVLVLCVGKGLKVVELLTNCDKEYVARVKLGIETDTLDITGNLINKKDASKITREDILLALDKFKGKIVQEVPKYSAVKVNGKKLYEYARNNIDIKLPTRDVEIYKLDLISNIFYEDNCVLFDIRCFVSKGTYIRSLIRDIGLYLGCYATMVELRRVSVGKFNVKDACTIDQIKNGNYELLKIADILDMKKIIVDGNKLNKVKNGAIIDKFFSDNMAMLVDSDGKEIAIYENVDNCCKPWKVF